MQFRMISNRISVHITFNTALHETVHSVAIKVGYLSQTNARKNLLQHNVITVPEAKVP